MDRLLWYVFAGSRGGATRIRIVQHLLEHPHNTNELSRRLGMDYKSVEYQLRVLRKHTYVVAGDEPYGRLFHPSKNLLAAMQDFEAVAARVNAPGHVGKARNTQSSE